MFNVESFIDELFEMKADTIYTLKDKEELKKVNEINKILNDLYNILDKIKHQELKEKINNLIDNIDIESSNREQKIYKIGFSDAVKMMIDVIKV